MSSIESVKSGISGISDIRRFPRLGKIRLGIKKEGQRGPYPQAVDYFVCPDEVQKVYSHTPRELKIMFPSDDIELIAPQFMKCYSYSQGLICRGNARTCQRKVDTDTGDFASKNTREWVWANSACEPEHCPMVGDKQCRRVMSLLFILPDVPGLGVYQLDTSSYFSIVNINSQIAPASGVAPEGFLRQFTHGRIAFIPLILSVVPQEVNPPGAGRKVVHVLSVRAEVKLADIIRISRQRPSQVLLPPTDEDEAPEDTDQVPDDLFPPDVLKSGEEARAVTPAAQPSDEAFDKLESATKEPVPEKESPGHPVSAAAPTKPKRDSQTIKTIAELYRACHEDFKMQPKEVLKELGYSSQADISEKPSLCYQQIAAARG